MAFSTRKPSLLTTLSVHPREVESPPSLSGRLSLALCVVREVCAAHASSFTQAPPLDPQCPGDARQFPLCIPKGPQGTAPCMSQFVSSGVPTSHQLEQRALSYGFSEMEAGARCQEAHSS